MVSDFRAADVVAGGELLPIRIPRVAADAELGDGRVCGDHAVCERAAARIRPLGRHIDGGDEEPMVGYINHFLIITGIRPVGSV